MKTLAIDLSGDTGSLLWCGDGALRVKREWPVAPRDRRPIFSDLLALVQEGTLDPAGIDCLAVGIGPGAFSGLRASVSLVRALALPGKTRVMAVSSARALAGAVLDETGADQVVVWGDARRQELWAGRFRKAEGIPVLQEDWVVAPVKELPAELGEAGTIWVTADWARIGSVLTEQCPAGVVLIQEARQPCAAMVADLVQALVARGLEGEPPAPIYIHPAVSVAPRFT